MIKTEGRIIGIRAYELTDLGRSGESDIIEFKPIYICEVVIDNQKKEYRVNSHITEKYGTEEEAIAALRETGYSIGKKVTLYINPEKSKRWVNSGIMPNARLAERMSSHKNDMKRAIKAFFLGPFLIVAGLGGGILFSICMNKRKKKKIKLRKKNVKEIIKGKSNGETF
jgi:hypothetical protein